MNSTQVTTAGKKYHLDSITIDTGKKKTKNEGKNT